MELYLQCPHCGGTIETTENEIFCGIFRHAYLNGTQINPHATKAECDNAINNGALGCGGPFRVLRIEGEDGVKFITEICDYI